MIDKELLALVKTCARELDELEADWAVAGATAMAAHGYERFTKDVDLFIADDVRKEFINALEADGLGVERVMPPSHYSVEPAGNRDGERRVDLLFPALGVESLGLMAARRMNVEGLNLPVIPLQHLVAAKLLVDPAYERDRYGKDMQDLRELRARGLIDVKRVEVVLQDVSDKPAIERLHTLMNPARDEPVRDEGGPAPSKRTRRPRPR